VWRFSTTSIMPMREQSGSAGSTSGPKCRFLPSHSESRTAIADFDALVANRKRTRFSRALLEQLPNLRIIAQTGNVSETLTYYAFPDIHWQKIRTNNPLERIMKEIRRRTRVVGAFPDGQSCLNLAAARLRYIAGTAWSAKCYMNMRPLYQPQVTQTEAVA